MVDAKAKNEWYWTFERDMDCDTDIGH